MGGGQKDTTLPALFGIANLQTSESEVRKDLILGVDLLQFRDLQSFVPVRPPPILRMSPDFIRPISSLIEARVYILLIILSMITLGVLCGIRQNKPPKGHPKPFLDRNYFMTSSVLG